MSISGSITQAWDARVAAGPHRDAIRFGDAAWTAAEVDAQADALAAELQERGVAHGTRIGIYLQNVPLYPVALLALWKIGAIAVPLNPMYRGAELRRLIDDSGTSGMVVAADVDRAGLDETLAGSTVRWVLSEDDVEEVLAARPGRRPSYSPAEPDETAFITYTSGTTGPPKGALNTHRNFLHAVSNYARWVDLQPGDVSFAIAPLFHITGLSLNAGIALLNDATLSLAGRFEAQTVLDTFVRHGVTTTIGSITAFNALLRVPAAGPEHVATVRALWSGGAPIPPATIEAFRSRFGLYLHNIWGMTETTGGGIAVPHGAAAPVHEPSGTLSIGVAMQDVELGVVDDDGNPLPAGSEGELVFTAPQVIPGYWQNPEATAHALPGGHLHTGDVAVIDEEGWVYLVDRKKDQINAGGFKVWPREVEDALYEHPAVFEAAVVGEPDDYRGETVVAYVSLHDGAAATPEELVAFSKERLAAYKYPRKVVVLPALPKTATGKIQRAVLREGASG